MQHEGAATASQSATKPARRPRQPSPRRRTPLGSVRRFNELTVLFARELGITPTTAEREQLRQAAALVLRAEQLQHAIIRGEQVATDELIRLSSESRRVLAGLRKRAGAPARRGPSLAQYL